MKRFVIVQIYQAIILLAANWYDLGPGIIWLKLDVDFSKNPLPSNGDRGERQAYKDIVEWIIS